MAAHADRLPGETDLLSPPTISDVKYLSLQEPHVGDFHATNFKITFTSAGTTIHVPLGAIAKYESIEVSKTTTELILHCRDLRLERFQFNGGSFKQVSKKLLRKVLPKSVKDLFAYKYRSKERASQDGWQLFNVDEEYFGRQMVQQDKWMISLANGTYDLCKMYPREFLVPQSTRDTDLWRVAIYRGEGRIPLLSWYDKEKHVILVRASRPNPILLQDMVGMTPVRNEADQRYVKQLLDTSASPRMFVLNIIDTDDKVGMAQLGEALDESYPECIFFNEPLVPAGPVAESYMRLQNMCTKATEMKPAEFRRELSDTDWVQNVEAIQRISFQVAKWLDGRTSVLVQSRDGDDSCAQIMCLVQLMLDPFFRTLRGFCILVEKEWVFPGHRFCDFTKSSSSRHTDDSTLSPATWTQFIDCVWQLVRGYREYFEFNEDFLVYLLEEVVSCKFGTFLCHCEKSRQDQRVQKSTDSIWTHALSPQVQPMFINAQYKSSNTVFPLDDAVSVSFWSSVHLRNNLRNPFRESHRMAEKKQLNAIESKVVDISLTSLKISVVNPRLYHMANITRLVLISNFICEIRYEMMKSLPNLVLLDLTDNYIASISNSVLLAGGKKLAYLNLSKNVLATFPSDLSSLESLATLTLSGNKLEALKGLEAISNTLTCLDCSKNSIDHIESLETLTNATTINLSNNQIVELNGNLAKLSKLEHLELRGNKLTEVPKGINDMKALNVLDLSENPIDVALGMSYQVGAVFCVPTLQSLRMASLSLKSFPQTFPSVPANLRVLDLQNNKLTSFPTPVLDLVNLTVLFFNNNDIEVIPFEICRLQKLRRLAVCDNRLTFLTSGIGKLEHLEVLEMHNNQIEELPPALAQLRLRQWTFEGNPICNVPPEVLRSGKAHIMEYLQSLLSGSRRLYRMKFMIVGQENVGKTCLMQSLLRSGEKTKKKGDQMKTLSTDGIDIHKYKFSCPVNQRGKPDPNGQETEDVTLSAWDFGGQEVYYTTHQFFLSSRSVYVVAWNLSLDEEFCRVEYWLQSVLARAKGCRIILVGTHLDHPKCTPEYVDKVVRDMKAKYVKKVPGLVDQILTLSSQTGEGVEPFMYLLQNVSLSERTMGELLPNSFMRLEMLCMEEGKTRKSSSQIPLLSWENYKMLAQTCGISDGKQLGIATQLLHNLGSIVHFPGDDNLADIVVLDPSWLTELMATIVTTKHQFVKEGKIQNTALKQIWRAPQFPPSLHLLLYGILEKFEVIFRLDKEGRENKQNEDVFFSGQSLVPSLLPEAQPAGYEGFTAFNSPTLKPGEIQYGRQYRFNFLPHGIFSRLTIRLHCMMDVEAAWKRGLVLAPSVSSKILVTLSLPSAKKKYTVLSVLVRGKGSERAFRLVLECIDTLVEGWYEVEPIITIPCLLCMATPNCAQEHYHSLEECEKAVIAEKKTINCLYSGGSMPLELLVPDILMVSVGEKQIDFESLQVENKIGEGGFADVFRGVWKNETVAIKKLKFGEEEEEGVEGGTGPGGPTPREAFAEFRREVFIMANLQHPCLCGLAGFAIYPPSIVCEFVDKGDLYTFLHLDKDSSKYVPMTWPLRLRLAMDMAKGMRYLHTRDPPIIHRDLKTPNVLLKATDVHAVALAKVADFGLSQTLAAPTAGRVVTNPVWLAPEIMDKKPYTEKADVYSYGVMLWELVTQKDFFGECAFMSQIEEFVQEGQRPPIPKECPAIFEELITACWAQHPFDRPSFISIVATLKNIIRKRADCIEIYEVAVKDDVDDELEKRKQRAVLSTVRVLGLSCRRNMLKSLYMDENEDDEDIYVNAFITTRGAASSSSSALKTSASAGNIVQVMDSGTYSKANLRTSSVGVKQGFKNAASPFKKRKSSGMRDENSSLIGMRGGGGSSSSGLRVSPRMSESLRPGNRLEPPSPSQNVVAGPVASVTYSLSDSVSEVDELLNDDITKLALSEALAGPLSANIEPQFLIERPVLPAKVECLCASEELAASMLWVGCANGTILAFKPDSSDILLSLNAHQSSITALSRAGNQIWSADAKSVRAWSLAGKLRKEYTWKNSTVTCYSAAGTGVWAGAGEEIHFFDSKNSLNKKKHIKLEEGLVTYLLFHNQTMWIGTTKSIARASVKDMTITSFLAGVRSPTTSLLSVGAEVWSSHLKGEIIVWDGETGKNLIEMAGPEDGLFNLHLQSSFVWSQCKDGSVIVWDAKSYTNMLQIGTDLNAGPSGVEHCGEHLWVGAGRKLAVWTMKDLLMAL